MVWIVALFTALVTLGALARFGKIGRTALELAVAACLVGLAGYAWQGTPDLSGQPKASTARE